MTLYEYIYIWRVDSRKPSAVMAAVILALAVLLLSSVARTSHTECNGVHVLCGTTL
jgi:hypothetical protein